MQEMGDCLKDMLAKSKELLIETDDKLKIALSTYPDDEEINKILAERNTIYKELDNEAEKGYQVVEDSFADYDNKQISDGGINGDHNGRDDEDSDKGKK